MWTCVLLSKHTESTSVPYSLLGVKPTLVTGDYLVLITTLLLPDSSGALLSPANGHQLLRRREGEKVSQLLRSVSFSNSCEQCFWQNVHQTHASILLEPLEHCCTPALLEIVAVVEIAGSTTAGCLGRF